MSPRVRTAYALTVLHTQGADAAEARLEQVTEAFPTFAPAHYDLALVRHLLSHISGMPDMLPENAELRRAHAPLEEFVRRACEIIDFSYEAVLEVLRPGVSEGELWAAAEATSSPRASMSAIICLRASKRSMPRYGDGASPPICASSSRILIMGRPWRLPISKSLGSWAGVTLTAPVPNSISLNSSAIRGMSRFVIGR